MREAEVPYFPPVVKAAVALLIAAFVIGDLVVSATGLWHGAGWYALIGLAFPAFIAFAVWRGWGGPRPY